MYALVATAYARGWKTLDIKSFKKAYQEAMELYPEGKEDYHFIQYIWDNYWSKLADGESVEIYKKANDARFETFVKGRFDFSKPDGTYDIGTRQYVYYNYLPQDAERIFSYEGSSSIAMQVVELARSKVGCPYTNDYPGRIGPDSFDCSGLVYWLYHENFGINVPWSTAGYGSAWDSDKIYENVNGLTDSELRQYLMPGDVLIRMPPSEEEYGHAALYIGNDEIIHAAGKDKGVVQQNLYKYSSRGKFTKIYRFWDN